MPNPDPSDVPTIRRRLSRELVRVFRGRRHARVHEIVGRLRGRELGLLLVVIGTPFLIPMPSPGLSTPAGIALALLGLRFIGRADAAVPDILGRQSIPPKGLALLRRTTLRLSGLLDRWVKPRWGNFADGRTLIGLAIVSASLALAVPGPGSNVVPALALITLGLGLLGRDGLILAVGAVLSLVAWIYVGAIGLLVWAGVQAVRH